MKPTTNLSSKAKGLPRSVKPRRLKSNGEKELEDVEKYLRGKDAKVVSPVFSLDKNIFFPKRKKSLILQNKKQFYSSGLNNFNSDKIVDSLLVNAKIKSHGIKLRKKKVRFLTQFTDLKGKENYLCQENSSEQKKRPSEGTSKAKLHKITNYSRYRLRSIPEYKLFYLKNSVNSQYLSDKSNSHY